MLDKDTEVTVVGFSDPVMPIIDFKEYMPLGETLNYIKTKMQNPEYGSNGRFEIGVYLDMFTPIYSYYCKQLHVQDEFKDEPFFQNRPFRS